MIEMPAKKCLYCGADMEDYDTCSFRIGGTGGEWSFIVGDIVEIEQGLLPVKVFICPNCGKIELFANGQTLKILLSRKGLKKCTNCGKKIPLATEQCSYCGASQLEEERRRK